MTVANERSEASSQDPDQPQEEPRGPVTIAYIAESAGVSMPTVSKALNGKKGVSDDTRARIEELINRYGYRKPLNHSDILELVFRELRSMWAVEIIRGVEQVARRNHIGVMVSEFGLHDSAGTPLDGTLARCVLSVMQPSEAEREQLRTKGIPFVVFDPVAELPDDVPFVGATNWRGGRSATQHLIDLGHRRIAMISGPQDVMCFPARQAGYESAMTAAGLSVDPEQVVIAPLTTEGGCAAARRLLGRCEPPTAIFAADDLQALGVCQAAREAGLRVPEELSVVGFDDLPVVAWADPPLTTVHQPLTEMAAAATKLALALGRGQNPPQIGVEIATTLTVRASTAPPKH